MGYGASLKEILDQRNMTVIELSEKTGIPATTLYSIIKRNSFDINLDTLSKICNVLGTDATYILLNENFNDDSYQTYYNAIHQYKHNLLASKAEKQSQESNIPTKFLDISDLTENETNEVKQFIEFLKSKRSTNPHSPTTD